MRQHTRRNRAGRVTTMLAILLTAGTMTFVPPALACTSFLLPTSDGSSVYGRTMEFGFDLKSEVVVIPRGFAFSSAAPENIGLKWSGKHGAVGMNGMGLPIIVDGMNEKGLVGGVLYFPGYAGYTKPTATTGRTGSAPSTATKANASGTALAPWEVVTWALSNFSTVAEIKTAIADISVVEVVLPALGIVPPFHYTFHDETGASLVVEPINGKLKVYDNPVGVMTNSPPFDWHLTNLKNYVKLSPVNAEPVKIFGQTISSFGEGSGLLGIPGDPTPPSRFIRAVGYAVSVQPKPSGNESVRLAEHVLNNFDIPKGFVKPNAGNEPSDYTQWSAVADLKNRRYYVKSYTDQVLRGIDLMSFDLDAKNIVTAPVPVAMEPPMLPFPSKQ